MSGVNRVILVGNVGKDPDIIGGKNGKIARFSIATSDVWRDKSGERKEITDWHNIVVFDKALVEIVEKYVTKGKKVYVEGKQKTRKWEKDGIERYSTETVLMMFDGKIQLLTPGGDGGGRGDTSPEDYGTKKDDQKLKSDMDDEIPF